MFRRLTRHLRWRLVHSSFLGQLVREITLHHAVVCGGPASRVELGRGVVLNDALLNVGSGRIVIGDHSFCGHGVTLLAGAHDPTQTGSARQYAIPTEGRDIIIGEGVWLATNSTVLGPCVVGDNAVVAAGALVTGDVAPGLIVGGVPARPIGKIAPL
jgi:acetyltransferase-like isoleucine patch superfamily enzyme